ncbi:MAG: ShlB/FhaC/HecB family hemolysin secretion/activation protein [Candidatus Omnitrophica bacterium]|nr:ShlB/FhaC/HecB family hemolysin secretion/activation protein [Candidatus Omnitrophota bacterium]
MAEEAIKDPASEADVIGDRIRKEAEEQAKGAPHKEPSIQEAPSPATPSAESEQRFLVKEIIVQGNTVLKAEQLEPLLATVRQHEVTLVELKALADAIEQEYRRRGYLTTLVYVPAQRIEEGRVTLQVVEGKLGQVQVEGQRYFNAKRILWYWPFQSGDLLRYNRIRQSLIRMNEHPDRDVQAVLQPGLTSGTTDVILKVKDRFPLHAGFQWDRQGTQSIGRWRYGPSLRYNNLLGFDDRLLFGGTVGHHFGAAYIHYALPLSPSGTMASFGFSHAQVSPKRQFDEFGINGISQSYSTNLSQPLWDGERLSLQADFGFAAKDSRTVVQSDVSRRDRIRMLTFGPSARWTDLAGRWWIDQKFSFGLKGLGATSQNNPLASRPGADTDFFKMNLEIVRLQKMPWRTQALLSFETQLSPSKLTTQEELYLGGAGSVRGYPEGDYLADQGFLVRAEYLVPWIFLPDHWHLPKSPTPLQDQVHFVGFFDRAYGKLRAITGDEQHSRNLMGIGSGLRLQMEDDLSARLEWGFNIGDDPLTSDSPSTIHVSVRYDY